MAFYGTVAEAEVWRSVVGWEGLYEVSSLGRVRSLSRIVMFGTRRREAIGRVLKQSAKPAGYLFVNLCREGMQFCVNVHRLVAEAFLSDGHFDGAQVNHIDYNKANNIPSNLEWCTASQNIRHSYASGNHSVDRPIESRCYGERNGQSKITNAQVADIRLRLGRGDRGATVAKELGISKAQVSRIKTGKRWPEPMEAVQ